MGPAVGTLLGGYLMTVFGWRPVFIVSARCRCVALAVESRHDQPAGGGPDGRRFPAFVRANPEPPRTVGRLARALRVELRLLLHRVVAAVLSGQVARFLHGLDGGHRLLGLPAQRLERAAMGWLADRWIRAGRSPTVVYKGIMAANHVAGIVCMVGMVMLPAAGSIAALFVFEIVSGCSYPGLFAIRRSSPARARLRAGWACRMPRGIGRAHRAGDHRHAGRSDRAVRCRVRARGGVNVLGLIGWVIDAGEDRSHPMGQFASRVAGGACQPRSSSSARQAGARDGKCVRDRPRDRGLLARSGARVAMNDVAEEALARAVGLLRPEGLSVEAVPGDLSHSATAREVGRKS